VSDRLQKLLKQKQLLNQHLQWLDEEIAQEAAKSASPLPTTTEPPASVPLSSDLPQPAPDIQASVKVPPPPTSPELKQDAAPAKDDETEKILSSYSAPSGQQVKSAQRGCLTLAVTSFLVICGILFVVYWFGGYRDADTEQQESALHP